MAFDFQQLNLPPVPRLPAPEGVTDRATREHLDELNRVLTLYLRQVDNVVRAFVQNVPPVP